MQQCLSLNPWLLIQSVNRMNLENSKYSRQTGSRRSTVVVIVYMYSVHKPVITNDGLLNSGAGWQLVRIAVLNLKRTKIQLYSEGVHIVDYTPDFHVL